MCNANGPRGTLQLTGVLRARCRPLRAIPPPLRNDGFDHIGDIDHHNGLLYAPLERPSYINASFAVYNASTLQWTGRAALTPQQHMCVLSRMTSAPVPCGMPPCPHLPSPLYFPLICACSFGFSSHVWSLRPWCAVSEADSLLYSSEFDNVSSVYAYDLATLHQTAQVMLRGVVLMGVQGGAFQQDRLYLSCNDDFIYCFVPVAAASPVAFELEYRFSANFTGEVCVQ